MKKRKRRNYFQDHPNKKPFRIKYVSGVSARKQFLKRALSSLNYKGTNQEVFNAMKKLADSAVQSTLSFIELAKALNKVKPPQHFIVPKYKIGFDSGKDAGDSMAYYIQSKVYEGILFPDNSQQDPGDEHYDPKSFKNWISHEYNVINQDAKGVKNWIDNILKK